MKEKIDQALSWWIGHGLVTPDMPEQHFQTLFSEGFIELVGGRWRLSASGKEEMKGYKC